MIENKTNLLQKIKLNSCGNIFFHSNETFNQLQLFLSMELLEHFLRHKISFK